MYYLPLNFRKSQHSHHSEKIGSKGFTLIEAMVVVAMIAILSALAMPSVSGVLKRYHLREAARNVYSDLQLAKATAIKEGSQCTVIFNGSGYTLFLDLNGDFSQDASDILVKTVQWSNFKDVTFSGTTFAGNAIGFRPDCTTASSGGGFGAGSVILAANGEIMRVLMASTGSMRIR